MISSQIYLDEAEFPQPDIKWIEKRFWIWIHYTATKIGRGELFEAIEALGFIRVHVLGPLVLKGQDARPQGLRKLEVHADETELQKLRATLAVYDAKDCLRALRESIKLYESIRLTPGNKTLETHVKDYLDQIDKQIG